MSRQLWMRDFCTRGAVIGALVLLAAVGFCIVAGDHDGDHHAGSLHVCLAMVAASLAPASTVTLFVTGSTVILSVPRVATVILGVALPPPKFIVSR